MKSINVLAILLGEGFSVLFDDADDRISTRIAGVIVGLVYAALVLMAMRGITARWRERRNGPAPDTRQFEPARAGRRYCDQGLPRRPATSDRPTPAQSTECHPQRGNGEMVVERRGPLLTACLTRSSACDTFSQTCARRVLCWCAFPSIPSIRSTGSAARPATAAALPGGGPLRQHDGIIFRTSEGVREGF
jgi:hypothetical protein